MILRVVNNTLIISKIPCTRFKLSPLIQFKVSSYKKRFLPDLVRGSQDNTTLRIKIIVFQLVSIYIGYNWKSIKEFNSS